MSRPRGRRVLDTCPMRAARRWGALVRARLAEVEKLAPDGRGVGPGYWDARRARRYAAAVTPSAERDPFLARLRRLTGSRTTVLDVGAGTGRFALAIAPRVAEVVAVDSSPAMLALLRRQARRDGIGNVRCVDARWEEADVPAADVAICSYVLPLVVDAASFLRKLHAACSRRALVYLPGASADLVLDPFWRHFHGKPRRPSPTYLDAVAVLRELGIAPDVEVVEVPVRSRFADLGAAVAHYREALLLPPTPAVRRELATLLRPWLVGREGDLRPPMRTTPGAILGWDGGRSQD